TNHTKKELVSEIKLLNERVESLEEEIKTLYNPGTSSLWQILKYLLRSSLLTENLKNKEKQLGSLPPKRKKKIMPFYWLLTNEELLNQLKEA
ncbi:2482_t:CDS:1, partial [Dentiscutata heterogama]